MIKRLKNLIRKNEKLIGLYRKLVFFENFCSKDILDFKKLMLFSKVYPYTMLSYQRLSNIYDLSKLIESQKRGGAFVECGAWKGGCAAVMAFVAEKAKSNRKVWLFDSFEGLPEPTNKDGLFAKEYSSGKTFGNLAKINILVGLVEDVKKIFFSILKINKENTVIKKGWFQNTLPEARDKIGNIAILHLDGDWYESTKFCLDNLYNNVIEGGYVIIDDYYYLEGCRKAVDEFFKERNIKADLIKIDEAGAYFKKS